MYDESDELKKKKLEEDMKFVREHAEFFDAYLHALDMHDLAEAAPHKGKYINRYNIEWLIGEVKAGKNFKYVTFWNANEGDENRMFSQWYKGAPIKVNGRSYVTAEQYMMSEKALLFNDLESYQAIMNEPDPAKCKALGRKVKNFKSDIWNDAFREIIFHGNLAKLQSDIEIVGALLDTDDAILVEASPLDDIYGAGLSKDELLNPDGTLKVMPWNWHKKDSAKQAENNLGFVLMGVRDLLFQLMGINLDEEEES